MPVKEKIIIFFLVFSITSFGFIEVIDKNDYRFNLARSFEAFNLRSQSKLDQAFLRHIKKRIKKLSFSQRNYFLKGIRNIEFKDQAHFGDIITIFGRSLIKIRKETVNHPVGRLTLVHELAHLEARCPKGFRETLKRYFNVLFDANFDVKEEALAYGAEYDFIRKVYKLKDLPKLTRFRYGLLSATDRRILTRNNILVGLFQVNYEKLVKLSDTKNLALRRATRRLWKWEQDRNFVFSVQEALTQSRKQFIGERIGLHRNQQKLIAMPFVFLIHLLGIS